MKPEYRVSGPLLRRDFGTLFCSHRGVVEDGRRAVEEKVEWMEELRSRVREMSAAGEGVDRIRDELLGREDATKLLTFGHYSKRNLIEGCLPE